MSRVDLPGCRNCDGLRRDEDGTIWLTKENKMVEEFLDRTMLRVRPGELRWREMAPGEFKRLDIMKYKNVHEGMVGLMLGKGPSLDRFLVEGKRHRWHVIPIGINEAGLHYPCKYVFALDDGPLIKLAQGRVQSVACVEPKQSHQAFKDMAVWEWGQHASPGYETAPVALEIMSGVMGIKTFVMVGFDGYDSGKDDYAQSLQLPPRPGSEGNYKTVNDNIDRVALIHQLNLVWWHRGGSAGNLEGQQRLTKPRATGKVETSPTT
jgi:hypothetical protein